MSVAISELNAKREAIERSYGPCASGFKTMNAVTGEGSLSDIISFVQE
jgi:CRISPR system Cascade subunit CasC